MKDITVLGIDLAKNVFQLHGADSHGRKLFSKQVTRQGLFKFVGNLKPCVIAMEACGGSHHFARLFRDYGHEVRLMSPQFVKPYVKGNKNDSADAEAIAEAVTRPTMRYVGIKEVEDQDIQGLHRYRERLVKNRTQLMNQIRGLLQEYGIVVRQGKSHLLKTLVALRENEVNKELTPMNKELFWDAYEELMDLDQRIEKYTVKLEILSKKDERSQDLLTIPGIGSITATAILAAVGDPHVLKSGRELSAYFGLTPKHQGSGQKTRILGISKRGDRYVRSLLIHGARSLVKVVGEKTDPRSQWIKQLIDRCGINKAVVAVANKNVRIVWALLTKQMCYQENYGLNEVA